ncbi:AAA family ATPase [Nocardioides daejeonensis]|uniref:AAA family ATPase n=1 Tax=Nocardioides daejeonensis TaxID=1046556 RepID=UPI000D748C53|nr:MoxR family ATPase [Nocardioides daejeonensis]
MSLFTSVDDARTRLASTGYLVDDELATVVFLADAMGKPLLLEGSAGTGKTELAKAVAASTGATLVRLQCYEGLDEARALYEWNYRKQLLRIQATQARPDPGRLDETWDAVHEDIFSEEFLLERPLLAAIRSPDPVVLLIDETDKADVEVEGLLLELLSDFQVTIPELGTIRATRRPFVVLTSNATRELSEALKRRCLHSQVHYPNAARERAIVRSRVPEASEALTDQIVKAVRGMRALDLRKPPSVAETIDWARAVGKLGGSELGTVVANQTLGVVLKNDTDKVKVREQLRGVALAPSGPR